MITQQIVWVEAIQRIMNPIHAAFAILFGALLKAIKGTQYTPRALVELRIVSPKLPRIRHIFFDCAQNGLSTLVIRDQ